MDSDVKYAAERRVLLVAPTTRDAEVTRSLLARAGLECVACQGLRELAQEIETGVAVVLLAEEALANRDIGVLLATLSKQPSWSDLAIVLLMHGGMPSPSADKVLRSLTNVTLLERPAPTRSVVSAVQAAVRGRGRQYQIRDQIESIRRAEEAARELQRQLEIAIDASELGTFHCDMPLNRIVWNARCKEHFWLPPDAEVDFDLFYSILHPDDRERTRQAVDACVNGGDLYDIEYRTVSPQGDVRWVRATGRTWYDEHRQPMHFDGTTQDTTSRKQTEAVLKDADRRKDEFLATLAHELRNPLGPIRNSLHLLRLSGELSPSLDPVQEIMERQVDHMVRLIDDLLDVSRISRGKFELRTEPVELATVISAAVETVQPLIDAAGHQLALSLPAAPIMLDADPVRLAQTISNLLNNAVKYTKHGGQIWLTARAEGNEAVCSIRDTGVGIPAEMITRVFDMFAQVDHTITRSQGGLGIGLTLAKSFIEMHGGRIEAHSEGPDQGSEFVVHLPLAQQSLHCPARTPRQLGRAALSRRQILIVDDTRAAAFVLGKLLESMGQSVRAVGTASAALESIGKEPPDLVISDIAMPGMDGYELAHRIRIIPGMETLPLVALTGYGQDTDRERSKEAGFDYHLVKPASLEALQDLLVAITARRVEGNPAHG